MSKSSREIADRKVRSSGQYFCACGKDVVTGDEGRLRRGEGLPPVSA